MIYAFVAAAFVIFALVRLLRNDNPKAPPDAPAVIATPTTSEPALPPTPTEPPVIATAPDASEEELPPIIYDAAPRAKRAIALRPPVDDEAGAPLAVPTETPAPASSKEDDDATVAFTETRRHQATLRTECWDASDKTSQVVNVTAQVDPSGTVTSATATSPDTKLAQCVQGQVGSWTFPASKKPRSLSFPVRFRR
jgi:hypothetical protein